MTRKQKILVLKGQLVDQSRVRVSHQQQAQAHQQAAAQIEQAMADTEKELCTLEETVASEATKTAASGNGRMK